MPHVKFPYPGTKADAQQCARDAYFKDAYNRFAKRLAAGGASVLQSPSVNRLKYECYKIRLGKNESHRIILYDCKKHSTMYVLFVYAKNKQSDVSDSRLAAMVAALEEAIAAGEINKPPDPDTDTDTKPQIDTLKREPLSFTAVWNNLLALLAWK